MKRNTLLALAVVAMMGGRAAAAPIVFTANLDGPSEVPPNASPATGLAFVTIDEAAHTMRVDVVFDGLLAPNAAAHIHVIDGPGDSILLDTLGPVATTTPTFSGFPTGTTSGVFDQTFDMTLAASYRAGWVTDSGGIIAGAEAALFAGIVDGRGYFNIHSTAFPGGEIRGFLQPVVTPEPASILLFASGAAAVLLRRRSRQYRS
jgi:hypothetical protein